MKKIAIVGAGGMGKEVFCLWKDSLLANNTDFEFLGFYDDNPSVKENYYGNVIGRIEEINKVIEPVEIAIAISNPRIINEIRSNIRNPNIVFPNIFHPSVKFLGKESLQIGEGNIFSMFCVISCNVKIGNNNFLNTSVTFGHDVELKDYNVFSPNVQISGSVKIGSENYFGFNSGILQGKKIGNNNTIGVGSFLLRNINDGASYHGNPAIKIQF